MKKNIRKLLAMLVALVLVIGCIPAAQVQAAEVQTWTDDFSSGKGDSYIPYGYWWNMDGQLTVGDTNAGSGVCYYWLKDMVWGDFVMEFDVIQQSSEFGVIFRAQETTANDCQNYGYGVLSDTNWAFFMAENGSFSSFDGVLFPQGLAQKVDNCGWACQPGTSNVHWKIVADGNMISVYFNNSEDPSMVMTSEMYASGYIGFRTNNPGGTITAVVDNLTITAINNEPADDNTESDVPKTGDSTGLALAAALSVCAAAAVVLMVNKRRFAI